MSSAILKINNVTRRFPNGTTALNNVTFSINEGEFTVICGRNGSGKSVLMSLIAQFPEIQLALYFKTQMPRFLVKPQKKMLPLD